jgi:hypothetical protein
MFFYERGARVGRKALPRDMQKPPEGGLVKRIMP